ncbi:hypothetical protein EYF80_039389 [Liparis tanakae]|uniref:Uncharacterized protein n=1 Tax=Liparis tanakae TaxID=230148 RepID=A0A4Z2GCP1_9TELE|nr:hypothetical protein EYF80_039389 [Liparis tanakae]
MDMTPGVTHPAGERRVTMDTATDPARRAWWEIRGPASGPPGRRADSDAVPPRPGSLPQASALSPGYHNAIRQPLCHRLHEATCVSGDGSGGNLKSQQASLTPPPQRSVQCQSLTCCFTSDTRTWGGTMGKASHVTCSGLIASLTSQISSAGRRERRRRTEREYSPREVLINESHLPNLRAAAAPLHFHSIAERQSACHRRRMAREPSLNPCSHTLSPGPGDDTVGWGRRKTLWPCLIKMSCTISPEAVDGGVEWKWSAPPALIDTERWIQSAY